MAAVSQLCLVGEIRFHRASLRSDGLLAELLQFYRISDVPNVFQMRVVLDQSLSLSLSLRFTEEG